MEEDVVGVASTAITDLGGKAWTAYVGIVMGALALLVVAIATWTASPWLTAALIAVDLVLAVFRVADLRSHRLYLDDIGVWKRAGILPWSKGVSGVKWRDLDEAVYAPSFWSWLLGSYTVRIGHRFTKSSEIVFPHKSRGRETVMAIQQAHAEKIRANALN